MLIKCWDSILKICFIQIKPAIIWLIMVISATKDFIRSTHLHLIFKISINFLFVDCFGYYFTMVKRTNNESHKQNWQMIIAFDKLCQEEYTYI